MIKSSKCAIFSDIHIGVHQDSSLWHKIALDWVRWFKSKCEERNIDDIIFCGDFFHYRDSIATNTLSQASYILDELSDFNITFITGNHDCYYKDTSDVNSLSILNRRANLTVVDKLTTITTDGGKVISFVPWGVSIDKIPPSDIIFGHFEIQSFKLNSHKVCDDGISPINILKKSPLVVTGHFHLRSERFYDDKTILYVGSPFQMDFGDIDCQKGIYFIDLETGDYEFEDNNISPIFVKICLSELAEAGNISDEIKFNIKDNIVRFVVDRVIASDDAEFLFKNIRALQPKIFDVDHDINFSMMMHDDNDCDLSGIDVEDAISEFVGLMDLENSKPVIDYVTKLYRNATNK